MYIVALAGDAGGANALAPVVAQLNVDGHHTTLLAYAQALALWRERGWRVQELKAGANAGEILDRLSSINQPDRLLTGTSFNPFNHEISFWRAAQTRKMPSLAVLDFWSSYRERFLDKNNVLTLPDRIAVIDETSRVALVAAGVENWRIAVTGQPAWDELEDVQKRCDAVWRVAYRAARGIGSDEIWLVFASQPLAAVFGTQAHSLLFPGYTEAEVFALVVAALETSTKVRLWLRPHPREDATKVATWASPALKFRVSIEEDRRELMMACDAVVGMTSMFLVEACLLGRPVVSLQPNLRGRDPLPTNGLGYSQTAYQKDEIAPLLASLSGDAAFRDELSRRAAQMKRPQLATPHVVRLLEQMTAECHTLNP